MTHRKVSTKRLEIYGIMGAKRHGKDHFAKLVRGFSPSFRIVHFASSLKRMCGRIFGLSEPQMHDEAEKEAPLPAPIELDLFVEAMRKETGLNIQPAGHVARTSREVMQYFGTEYVRRAQEDYWVQRLLGEVNGARRVLVPDARFPNEAEAIRSVGGLLIKIERIDLSQPTDGHASETEAARVTPELVLGVRTGELSLATRVAKLIAGNKFDSAQRYDYRRARSAISAYSAGATAEESSRLLGGNCKDPTVIKNLFEYYGIAFRNRGGGGSMRVPHQVIDGVPHKKCRCGWKPLADFNAGVRSWDGLAALCRSCASDDNKARYRQYGTVDTLERLVKYCAKQASYRSIPFELSLSDIEELWSKQGGRCYYSNVLMTLELGSLQKVTIDRVDSSLGYLRTNIVLCSYVVNMMKRSMSIDQFLDTVRLIHEYGACRRVPG